MGGAFVAGGRREQKSFSVYLFVRSPGTAGVGTPPIWCQTDTLKLATIARLHFGGNPASCLFAYPLLIDPRRQSPRPRALNLFAANVA